MLFDYSQDSDNVFKLKGERVETGKSNYADGITEKNFNDYVTHCVLITKIMSELGTHPGYHFENWCKFIQSVYSLHENSKS